MTKRKLAALWTAEGLCEAGKKCTFWTFTTEFEQTPAEMGPMWNSLRGALVREFGKLSYFRVIEPHKSNRRWHLHVIFDRSLPIRRVLEIGSRYGWGRTSCARVRTPDLAEYCSKTLGKYLTKSSDLKGVRLWSTSRLCAGRVRIRDVVWRINGKTWAEWFPAWCGIPQNFQVRREYLWRFLHAEEERLWRRALQWYRGLPGLEWLAVELGRIDFYAQ